jgi:TolA-binding protein
MAGGEDLVKAGGLAGAARALAAAQDAALEQRERPPLDARLASLQAARAGRRSGLAGRDRSGRLALGGGVSALAVAAAVALWVRATAPLEFAIGPERSTGQVGAWIASPPGEATPITFSDGSRIDLRADARARVVEVSDRGARVLLERGSAGVTVVHRDSTRWSIASGPFEVHVVGTRFEATWDAVEEALTVRLDEGEVAIAGACLGAPHRLQRGESVRLSCRDVVAAAPPPTSASPVRAEPVARVAALPTTSASAMPTTGNAPTGGQAVLPEAPEGDGWRELARAGKPKDAWRAAETSGLDALLGSLSAGELLELADLARLSGHGGEARRIYAVIRDRFSGSDAAAAAAFHLGRMSFDGSGAYAEAARWFSTYLAERPGGAFAPEATGRLMEAYERGGDRGAARAIAERYLARWPGGAHAALAQSLVAP